MDAQPDWMRTLQVGDVLTNGKSQRVVRHISRFTKDRKSRKKGELHCVNFAVMHCSWTHRAYTTLSYVELMNYWPTGHKASLRTKLDRDLAHDLEFCHRHNQRLDCCDVRGVI